MVSVTLTDEAREQLSELPRLVALRMEKLLTRLGQWPIISGVKHLRGDLAGRSRLRTGDYRLPFHVEVKKRKATETKSARGKGINAETDATHDIVRVQEIEPRDGCYE